MTFRTKIEALYQRRPHHFFPFIGPGYEKRDGSAFRAAVVGINAYADAKAMKERDKSGWLAWWWANAGQGKPRGETWPFYNKAYDQVSALAERLVKDSKLFKGLVYDVDAATKSGLYATNAIKVVLPEDGFKKSDAITAEMIEKHAPTWHAELDAMAEHEVFPHLIVVLGECIWESAWRALSFEDTETFPSYRKLGVHEYETASEGSLAYHHANRIGVQVVGREQHTLLVRLHHPSGRSKVKRDAAWLLRQPGFRKLARMA